MTFRSTYLLSWYMTGFVLAFFTREFYFAPAIAFPFHALIFLVFQFDIPDEERRLFSTLPAVAVCLATVMASYLLWAANMPRLAPVTVPSKTRHSHQANKVFIAWMIALGIWVNFYDVFEPQEDTIETIMKIVAIITFFLVWVLIRRSLGKVFQPEIARKIYLLGMVPHISISIVFLIVERIVNEGLAWGWHLGVLAAGTLIGCIIARQVLRPSDNWNLAVETEEPMIK